MATSSKNSPAKNVRPAYLSSLSDQTLTSSCCQQEDYSSQLKRTGRKRATSADAVTATERLLFLGGTEENTKKGTAGGPLVKTIRGLLRSPRGKTKKVPQTAEKSSLKNDGTEKKKDVPPPSVSCHALYSDPSSLSLISNQTSSFTLANSSTRERAGMKSAGDVDLRSVVSAGCKTACSADTIKHSNKHHRQQQHHSQPVSKEATEEKEEGKSRFVKTKQRIRKVINNALGNSAVSSSTGVCSSPKKAHSPKAIGKENERLNEIIQAPPTPPSSGRRRTSSTKKSPSTPKSKSKKDRKISSPPPPPAPPHQSGTSNHSIDEAIRGRLDGLDSLALGPIKTSSLTSLNDPSTRDIAHKAIRTSSGKNNPEMILEGVLSNGADRWTVQITANELKKIDENKKEQTGKSQREEWQSTSPYAVQKSTCKINENPNNQVAISPPSSMGTITTASSVSDVSHYLSALDGIDDSDDDDDDGDDDNFQDSVEDLGDLINTNDANEKMEDDALLLLQMWGKDNAPPPSPSKVCKPSSSTQRKSIDEQNNSSANLSALLASCQCPIDIDEDAFVIDSVLRLQGVHDVIGQLIELALFDDALVVFEKMLRGLKSQFGEQHRLVGSTVHNMGVVYMWIEEYGEALNCFEEATDVRRIGLKENHPDLVVSLSKKGMAHFAFGKLDEAKNAFEEAIDIRNKIIGRDHLELAKLSNNLGCVLYQKGQLVDALEYFTSALNIQRAWLEGPIRRESIVVDTCVILGNMGKVFFERNDIRMSINIFEEALLLQTTAFRNDHDIVLTTLSNLAIVKAQNNEELKAIKLYNGVLRSQNANLGCNSRDSVETQAMMCMIYVQIKYFEEAQHCLTAVIEWQKENLEETHPSVLRATKLMKRLEQASDDDTSVWI